MLLQAPPDVANFLLNEKRQQLSEIEARHNVAVIVVADVNLETPHLEIQRLRGSDIGDTPQPSYQRLTPAPTTALPQMATPSAEVEQPAVSRVPPMQPAPQRPEIDERSEAPAPRAAKKSTGLFARIAAWFAGSSEPEAPAKPKAGQRRETGRNERNERGQRSGRDSERRPGSTGQGTRQPKPDRADRPARGEKGKDGSGRDRGERGGRGSQRRNERQPANGETSNVERTTPAAKAQTKPERGNAEDAAAASAAVALAAVAVDETSRTSDVATNDAVPSTDDDQEGKETSKTRRRGRRGGRRRRKDSQTATDDASNVDDQSTKDDFDDEDGEDNDHKQRESGPKRTPPVAAADVDASTDAVDTHRTPKILDAVEAVKSNDSASTEAAPPVAHKSSVDAANAAQEVNATIGSGPSTSDPQVTRSITATEEAHPSEIPVPDADNTNADEIAAIQSTVDVSVVKVETGAAAHAATPSAESVTHVAESAMTSNQQDLPLSPPMAERLANNADDVSGADAAEIASSERSTPTASS